MAVGILLGVVGGLIALIGIGLGFVVAPQSAIHQIYGVLLTSNGLIGLIIAAVGIAAGAIVEAVHEAKRVASIERRQIAEALYEMNRNLSVLRDMVGPPLLLTERVDGPS